MSALARRFDTAVTSSSVLVFPQLVEQPSETEALSAPPFQSREFFEQLRAAFDTFVTDAFVKQLRSGSTVSDSPFDAVYISALEPDEVESEAIALLHEYAEIVDLSDSIQFADEWGD